MRKLILFTGFLVLTVVGCMSSTPNEAQEELEGRWIITLSDESDNQQSFKAYLDPQFSGIKIYPEESDIPFNGAGYVSDDIFHFTWYQSSSSESNVSTIVAEIEDSGNFMDGAAYVGYPLTELRFTALRLDSAEVARNLTYPAAPSAHSDSEDKYTSSCSEAPYAVINADNPTAPLANPNSTVTIGSSQCDLTGNSDAGVNLVQNAVVFTHPADTQVLFPGALLDGSALSSSNTMHLMDVGRGSGTFFLSDVSLVDGATGFIEINGPVTPLNVQVAINQLLPQISESTAIENITKTTSDSTFSFAADIGMGFEAEQIGSVGGSLSFDWSTASNFANYFATQAYYTVNFATPSNPETGKSDIKQFFSEDTDTCSYLTDQENPPVYISSVSYGRMFMATAQSTHSSVDIKEAMEAAASEDGLTGTVTSGVKVSDILNQTSISYTVYGGSGTSVAQSLAAVNGENMAQAWFNLVQDVKAAKYSIDNPGVPLLYTIKNVKGQTVIKLPYSFAFDSRHCYPAPHEQTTNYLYKFSLERSGEELTLCVNQSNIHGLAANNPSDKISWTDIADFLDGDTDVHIFTDNATVGKSHAYMTMYKKRNVTGSSWAKVWSKKFKTTNYIYLDNVYYKKLVLNKTGHTNKNGDEAFWPMITDVFRVWTCGL